MVRSVRLLAAVLVAIPPAVAVNRGEVFSQETGTRAAIPDDAAQREALRLVREVYKAEYDRAKTAKEKQALARKLFDARVETTEPANRYVLLKVARTLAEQAGDLPLALEVVDSLAASYRVDAFALKCESFEAACRTPGGVSDEKAIVEAGLPLLDEAVALDAFDAAARLGRLTQSAARKTRDGVLVNKAVARVRVVEKAARDYRKVKLALEVLDTNPADPDANLTVGRYLCLVKGDWDKGLPMLALSGDKSLQPLAVKELQGAEGPQSQMELGDGWWKLAGEEEATTKDSLQARAAFWYRKVLPGLKGLERAKVQGRLEQSAKAEVESTGVENYLAPETLGKVRFLDYQRGTWKNDAAPFFRVEKVTDGYKVTCDTNAGYSNKLIAFPEENPFARKLVASLTVEEGWYGLGLRPRDLSPKGTMTSLPAGKTYDIEMWIEDGAAKGTVNGQPMEIKANDPSNYGFYSFQADKKSVAVFHKLGFVDLKK